jgi:hypothetical protein
LNGRCEGGRKRGRIGKKRGRKIDKKRATCTNYPNCSKASVARYRRDI